MNKSYVTATPGRLAASILLLIAAACTDLEDEDDPGAGGSDGGSGGDTESMKDNGGGGGDGGHESDEPPIEFCPGPDMDYAPEPVDVGLDLPAVPIDVRTVEAHVVLDAAAETAIVEATMQFAGGAVDGYPVFDLQQEILSADLNDEPVDPLRMGHQSLSGGSGADMRVLEKPVEACSTNLLRVEYVLDMALIADCDQPPPLVWDTGTSVSWNFSLSDIHPACYAEQWLPGNLIYDHVETWIDLELRNTTAPHTLVTNGAVEERSETHWFILYPETFTSLSPMLVLRPSGDVAAHETEIALHPNHSIALRLFKDAADPTELADLVPEIEADVQSFVESTGPWVHEDVLTVIVDPDFAMEYDGAAITGLYPLQHELFHSWYGRGIKPARDTDGWVDEAWNIYWTEPGGPNPPPLGGGEPPNVLCDDNPWSRKTPLDAYDAGARVFSTLAVILGEEQLHEAMRQFYLDHIGGLFTTRELEQHLYCVSQDPEVTRLFHRFVYGYGDEPTEPDPGICDDGGQTVIPRRGRRA
ncbi:MAG: hypothetical protein HOW73_29650 [Polyangiaceae bacterium]|nr:hypothetical protein [Polyangiaceae bacterium]